MRDITKEEPKGCSEECSKHLNSMVVSLRAGKMAVVGTRAVRTMTLAKR